MNRKVFMERLRELLRDIPSEEREEALAYYESYFDEAGIEEEGEVIQELESPEKVAKTIKEDLLGNLPVSLEKPGISQEKPSAETDYGSQDSEGASSYENPESGFSYKEKENLNENNKKSKIILIVLLLILTFPIWIGLLGLVLGIIAAVFAGLFGGLLGLAGATGGILISGIALICVGIGISITGQPAAGILVLGVGLILLAIGILLLICTVWLCVKAIPAVCRGFVHLCQRLSVRKKEGVQ